MTLGVIGFGELSYLPFLGKYAGVLDAEGVAYDIVYWNREHLDEECPYACRRLHRYPKRSPIGRSLPGKMVDFLGYRAYLLELLRKNRYDRLILLTTMPAVLLVRTLTREYAGRYLFDVRDYAYEQFPPFYAAERALVRNAALCVSSSPRYSAWLPPADWKVSHNIDGTLLRQWLARDTAPPADLFRRPTRVLRFVGRTRSPRGVRAVVEQLKGDARYDVHYHGDEVRTGQTAALVRGSGAANVHVHGRYRPAERWAFYEDCDLVLSNYDPDLPGQATLLNNKLYDCALSLRPMLVSPGGYLAEVVARHGLGLVTDVHAGRLREDIEAYAAGFDPAAFARGCRQFLGEVLVDDEEFVRSARAFARGS